jgi:uncharacterized cupin superfamily protein
MNIDKHFAVIPPSEHRRSKPAVADERCAYRAWSILDEQTAASSMQVGIVELPDQGNKVPLHYHSTAKELQYVLSGTGVVRDAEGLEYLLTPHTAIFCEAGAEGAHEFENTGIYPLVILFIHPSTGGKAPDMVLVNG